MTARLIVKLRVAQARYTTPDVLHLTLVHPRKPELPVWAPGAHVDLRIPDGRVRQYSLCGDPADRTRYDIAIKREETGRGASLWAHANLTLGAIAHISAPRNNFPLAEGACRHVLVAGGIGITPIISMVRKLANERADFELHLCAPSAAATPFLSDLRVLCGERMSTWFSSERRRFSSATIGPPGDSRHLYVCGPQRLLEPVLAQAAGTGWPQTHYHSEVFKPISDESYKPEPFDAFIASTGAVLHVPADRSLLDVLRAHGLATMSSCELGVCGSCVCSYRNGRVIHRDVVLSLSSRQDRMMPCVSRAHVSVTLDL
jgi:vanillate O-demethylase ferredoxin subunit